MVRARNVMFTVFANEDQQLLLLDPELWPVTYVIYQREVCPTTNREHFQGYMEMEEQVSYTTMQRWEGLETAHFETRRGKQAQAIAYCSKEESRVEGPWEHGTKKDQGARSDLIAVKARLDEGASMRNIASEFFGDFVRYHNGFNKYQRMVSKQRDWPMEIHICIGPTGTGKTRFARDNFPGAYWKPKGKWWDNYAGEETVVIDEMYGSSFPFTELLQLMDRYPYAVEIKGGTVEFTSRKLVFTSNQEPEDWYSAERTHQGTWASNPLKRRIDEFAKITRTGEITRYLPPVINL